jgi:predicted SAM-dependent methyltransferase
MLCPIEQLIVSVLNGEKRPPDNLFKQYSLEERERFAYETKTMVQYYDDEVVGVREAEVNGALRAIPKGYGIHQLKGLNIGCGDRVVHPDIVNIDAHRGRWEMRDGSNQSYESKAAIIARAQDLPFKTATIDFVIALHVLEHLPDPVSAVFHWLDVVKPGGGVGIVVPDWRYTWDARNDRHPWGHRWNPTPDNVRDLHRHWWSGIASLESFQTYQYRLSFDFVLRKHGIFEPFDPTNYDPTGYDIAQRTGGAEVPIASPGWSDTSISPTER